MLSSINDKRHENRVQEIGEISRSLKALARELAIPVLALAQLSRAFESRSLKTFQLSDLRDGSLENDADLVLFLSLAETEMTGNPASPRLATISIAKHRNGPRADLDVCFRPCYTHFHDLPTLSHTATQERTTSSVPIPTDQSPKQFPRLTDILEQAILRQPRQEMPIAGPKTSSHLKELTQGYVLDEMEADSENKPDTTIASIVNEKEQNLG